MMKIYNKLDNIFDRSSKVKILRHLFREIDEQTGRGIARAIGMSPSVTHSVLTELSAERLLDVRKKGTAKLYRLRRGNATVDQLIKPLFEGEQNLYNDLVKDIKSGIVGSKQKVINISIFGSVAEGRETVHSDLDLLIVVGTSSDKKSIQKCVDKLCVKLAEKYGIPLFPYIITRRQLEKKCDLKLPLIKSIQANNQLIYGEPVEKIMA